MNKPTIAIDIDEVLAASGDAWLEWLQRVTGVKLQGDVTEYNLTSYFKEELGDLGMDGFEFWKGNDVYSYIPPVEGSVVSCEEFYELGYKLIPVSKVFPEHCHSKAEWLKKHFPMMEPPVFVIMDGYKSVVKCDVIIDDRVENLKGFTSPTHGIILNTPYLDMNRGCEVDIPYHLCWDWWSMCTTVKEVVRRQKLEFGG